MTALEPLFSMPALEPLFGVAVIMRIMLGFMVYLAGAHHRVVEVPPSTVIPLAFG